MYPFLLNTFSASGEPEKPFFSLHEDISENSEIFLLSGRDKSESVVKNGDFAGLGICEVLPILNPDLKDTAIPVFIKFLNTVRRTAVKVYPDSDYAASHGGLTAKKTLIYIADCLPDAEIVYGLSRTVSFDEIKTRTQNGSLSAVCNFVSVQKGDAFFIPAGVVFSLGAGICAVEISINSDAEYIISDYSSGRSPQLDRAVEVIKPKKTNIRYGNTGDMTLFPFGTVRELGYSDSFRSSLVCMDGNAGFYEDDCFASIVITSGELDVSYPSGTMHLSPLNSVLLPPGIKMRVSGRAEIIYTKIYY